MNLTKILDYSATTDIASALGIPTDVWSDVLGDQSFTVDDDTDRLVILVRGNFSVMVNGSAAGQVLLDDIDAYPLGGGITGSFVNILSGAQPIIIPSPGAGDHIIKLQAQCNQNAGVAYCRAASQAPGENLSIQIWALDD